MRSVRQDTEINSLFDRAMPHRYRKYIPNVFRTEPFKKFMNHHVSLRGRFSMKNESLPDGNNVMVVGYILY